MAQIRGTAGYHLGNQNNFGSGGNSSDATNDPSPLDAIREQTSKIEDLLDTWSEPIKPYVYTIRVNWRSSHERAVKNSKANQNCAYRYLPHIGRFLIVVTFLEDALRIITQWSDQLTYLHDYRHSTALSCHSPNQGANNVTLQSPQV